MCLVHLFTTKRETARMNTCRIVIGDKEVIVTIKRCKDLTCSRDDHIFCPRSECSELLHPRVETTDDTLYAVKMSFCRDMACFSASHLMCPECARTFHTTLKEVLT